MAKPKVRVKVEGIAEMASKLKDPMLLQEPMVDLLTESARLGSKVATERLDGGRGIAVRSVFTRVQPFSARVSTMMPAARVKSIEQGRKPGASLRELLGGIIRWKEAVGLSEAGIVIALGVQRRGVQGRFFMRAAAEAVNNALPDFLSVLARKMEGHWKR